MSHIALEMPSIHRTADHRRARSRHAREARRRQTRRARLLTALTMVLLAGAIIGSAAAPGGSTAAGAPTETMAVRVAPGETLWEIAGRFTPPGASTEDVVDQVMALNALSDPSVLSGTVIEVPVTPEARLASR